jgi:group I intron endonuclease
MKKADIGIYCIKNTKNCHIYVGSSVNLKRRWHDHKRNLKKNRHHSSHLQRAWNKYGAINFKFEILEEVDDINKLLEREQYFINSLNPKYNMSNIAGPSKIGEDNPSAKLNWGKVNEIRKIYNEQNITMTELSLKYGVDSSEISHVIFNKNWKDPNYVSPQKSKKLYGKFVKLSEKDAKEIRELYRSNNFTQEEIAQKYKVSRGCILAIIRNESWKDASWNFSLIKTIGHRNAILSFEKAREIRVEYYNKDVTMRELAIKYGVKDSVISNVVNNKTWKDENYVFPGKKENICYKNLKRGEARSFLCQSQVDEIRRLWSDTELTQQQIAEKLKVSRGCINNIVHNINWKDPTYIYKSRNVN